MRVNLIVIIISQCVCISSQCITPLKCIQSLFVNYSSIKLGGNAQKVQANRSSPVLMSYGTKTLGYSDSMITRLNNGGEVPRQPAVFRAAEVSPHLDGSHTEVWGPVPASRSWRPPWEHRDQGRFSDLLISPCFWFPCSFPHYRCFISGKAELIRMTFSHYRPCSVITQSPFLPQAESHFWIKMCQIFFPLLTHL